MARKSAAQKDSDLLDEINKNVSGWYGWYSDNIDKYQDDQEFTYLKQWDAKDVDEFDRLQKPMLTFNKLYDFVKKVVGEQRQNTPNLEVRSLNGKSSQDAITLRANLVRKIAYGSQSDIVYQTAFENALVGGWGAIRVGYDYQNAKSFNQEMYVRRIEDATRAFFDPNAKKLTKSDGNFCGVYDSMSRAEFEEQYDIPYPQSFPSSWENYQFNWGDRDNITIVEYHKKEWFSYTLYLLSDGRSVTDKEYQDIKEEYEASMGQEGEGQVPPMPLPEVTGTRKARDYKIMCYKAIYNKIIERYEWAGKELAIVFVPGHTKLIRGQEHTMSFIRFAMDAQRFLNYCGSEIAQGIKNSRREQFLGTPANVSGSPEMVGMWKNPSIQQGILLANPDPVTKQMPAKLNATELPVTLLQQYQRAENDIQSILGYYEANRGAAGQEISGVALQERQRTGNMGVAVFFDNLDHSIEQVGRVILSCLPQIYDTERNITVQTPDGKSKDLTVNRQIAGGMVENDLSGDDYDVCIKPGPNFAVQKEQALDILVKLVSVNPQTFPLVADLIAANVDIENGSQLVERFKTLVPPDITAKEAGQPPPPPQPNPQQQMMQQEMQFKAQELQLRQQQMMLDADKSQRQAQLDAAKNQLELQKLQFEQAASSTKAVAEVSKAQMSYKAQAANAMSKILSAQTAVHKTNHETARQLLSIDRPEQSAGREQQAL